MRSAVKRLCCQFHRFGRLQRSALACASSSMSTSSDLEAIATVPHFSGRCYCSRFESRRSCCCCCASACLTSQLLFWGGSSSYRFACVFLLTDSPSSMSAASDLPCPRGHLKRKATSTTSTAMQGWPRSQSMCKIRRSPQLHCLWMRILLPSPCPRPPTSSLLRSRRLRSNSACFQWRQRHSREAARLSQRTSLRVSRPFLLRLPLSHPPPLLSPQSLPLLPRRARSKRKRGM